MFKGKARLPKVGDEVYIFLDGKICVGKGKVTIARVGGNMNGRALVQEVVTYPSSVIRNITLDAEGYYIGLDDFTPVGEGEFEVNMLKTIPVQKVPG